MFAVISTKRTELFDPSTVRVLGKHEDFEKAMESVETFREYGDPSLIYTVANLDDKEAMALLKI